MPARHGPSLRAFPGQRWLAPRDVVGPTLVLVHGFTAHGGYFDGELAQYAADSGLTVAVFEYHSYHGISVGAEALNYRLVELAGQLSEHSFWLLGHSMGGLVVKQFCDIADESLKSALRGVITVGTPHGGALPAAQRSRKFIGILSDWAEHLIGVDPFLSTPACVAAKQLLGEDDEGLLDSLAAKQLPVPHLSISGGLSHVEVGPPGSLRSIMANMALQALIGELPNDGLVGESSSDATRTGSGAREHFREYPAYSAINHTHLIRCQDIGSKVVAWITAHR